MSKTPIPASQCPHLGAEYSPLAGPHLQDPYPFFERLRKEAPVTFSPMRRVDSELTHRCQKEPHVHQRAP